jgi:hypothetical protein
MLMYFAHEFEDELDAHLQRWHECSTARTAAPVTTIEQVELCTSVVIMVVIVVTKKDCNRMMVTSKPIFIHATERR